MQYKREKEMASRMFGSAADESDESKGKGLFSRFRRRPKGPNDTNGSDGSVSWSEGDSEGGQATADGAEEEDQADKGGGFWSRFRRGPHHFESDEDSDPEGDGAV